MADSFRFMRLKPQGSVLLTLIIALVVTVGLLIFRGFQDNFAYPLVGFCVLYGYLFLALVALTTSFLKECSWLLVSLS